ncbi:MAG: ATP-binding protein [Bacteroidota bacterium]|nr:ATP-binding protein [Bacteroidota bacterium]
MEYPYFYAHAQELKFMDNKKVSLKDLQLSERDLLYESPESEYAVKVEHVSDNIFRVIMNGYLDFESNLYYSGIIEMVLLRFREAYDNEQVLFIEDVSNLSGINNDAANYSEKKLLDWPNYGGCFFIGADYQYRKYIEKLQKVQPALLFQICNNEQEAFDAIIKFNSSGSFKPLQNSIEENITGKQSPSFEIPGTKNKNTGESVWEINTSDNHFTGKISMLENNVVHSKLQGYVRQNDVANYIRFIENLIEAFDIRSKQYSHIIEMKGINGVSRQAKTLVKNAIIRIEILPSILFFIDPPKAILNTLNILTTLFPGKLNYCKIEKSFDTAFKLLQLPKMKLPEVETKNKELIKKQLTTINEKQTNDATKEQLEEIIKNQEQRISELSEMVRNVSFNGTKKVRTPKINPGDPFYELFNAVGLMQSYYAESINDTKYDFESLRDHLGLLQQFANHSKEASLLVQSGRIRYANTAFSQLIGSEKSIIEDKLLTQLIIPDDKGKIESLLEKIESGDETPQNIHISVISETGKSKAVSIRIIQLKYKTQTSALLYFEQAKKRASSDMHQTLQPAKATVQRQRIGPYVSEGEGLKFSFLANISHEIRTPMTAIVGLAEFLTSPVISPQSIEEYVNLIKFNANSLLIMLNDLIDIASLESGEVNISNKLCNVNQILDAVYSRFSKFQYDTGNKNIVLKLNNFVDPSDISLMSDSDRIVQILSNLLSNSFKFTHKGIIEFGVFSITDERVRIFVRDTGIGIDPEKFEMIFENFKQVDESRTREHSGIGLGLAISQKIAYLLDGHIWVASKKGEGSTFYFELPRPDPASLPSIESKIAKDENLLWKEKTFLIVDDVDSSYQLLESILRKSKVKTLWAKDGEKAIGICKKENVDLVLMDIQLPNIDGLEATRQIKELYPNMPIIAQTAYFQEEDRYNIELAGCDDYIPKPIEKEILIDIINKHLDKSLKISSVD